MPRIKSKAKQPREMSERRSDVIIETRLLIGYNLTIDEYNTGELELERYYVNQD